MTDTWGTADVRSWIERAADEYDAQRTELTELDRMIGDGDHGENLARGFTAVRTALDAVDGGPAELLKKTGATLISTVGGAAGPLYGTAFLRMAKAVPEDGVLTGEALIEIAAAGLQGIVDRGKAEVGDKTMVDAWSAALDEARTQLAADSSATAVVEALKRGAATGAASTEPLVARKGRASYLGERAIGHRDPGAQSSALLWAAAAGAAA